MTHPARLLIAVLTLCLLSVASPSTQRANIAIDGTRVHPESLTSTPDGRVWIGSYADGTIYRAGPNQGRAAVWLAPDKSGLTHVLGVLADANAGRLWVCSPEARADGGRAAAPTELKGFNLDSAALEVTLSFPGGGNCNDMAVAADGTLYATDFGGGRVLRWKAGMKTLELWAEGPELASADGIALLADGAVYVNTFRTGHLLRIPVNADGSAGAVTPVTTSRPLVQPDGMRSVGGQVLLVAEGEGRLTELVVTGTTATARVIRDGFTGGPTAVTLVGDTAFVVEARFNQMKNPDPGPFEAFAVPYPRP